MLFNPHIPYLCNCMSRPYECRANTERLIFIPYMKGGGQFRQRCNKGSENTVPLILNSALIHPTAAKQVNGNNSCESSAVKERENKLGTGWDWDQGSSGVRELFLS